MDNESKGYFVSVLTNFIIALIPEIIFVMVILWLLNEEPALGSILIGLVVLNVFLFALWAVRTVFGWLIFWVWGKNSMANNYYLDLIKNKFPAPQVEESDPVESYFEDIVLSDAHKADIKIKAAYYLGGIHTLRTLGQLSLLIKLSSALKLALKRYYLDNESTEEVD